MRRRFPRFGPKKIRGRLVRDWSDIDWPALPDAIRSDNGAPFGSPGAGGLSRLSAWLMKLRVEPRFIPPSSPRDVMPKACFQHDGRRERMHRTMKDETVRPPAETWMQQQVRFNIFRREYNGERPHEAATNVFSYHRYGGDSVETLDAIWKRATQHGLKTAMLEKIGAGIAELFLDLTRANVSAWQQWALAARVRDNDKGDCYLRADISNPANPSITLASRTPQLSQVFKYVRSGAVRIEAKSSADEHEPIAFINKNGSWVTIVRIKSNARPLKIEALPAGAYGTRFVSDANAISQLAEISIAADQPVIVKVPEAGVVTVYGL